MTVTNRSVLLAMHGMYAADEDELSPWAIGRVANLVDDEARRRERRDREALVRHTVTIPRAPAVILEPEFPCRVTGAAASDGPAG